MKYLKRADILNAEDLKTEDVNVPEWGGSVCVRSLTGLERDRFEASMIDQKNKGRVNLENLRAKLVQKTVIDPETKELMFTIGDLEVLGAKSAAALNRIFTKAQELSGLTDKDVDELVKN